jgi:hypothetical protein
VEEEVIPVLYVKDAGRAVARYEAGLAGRECDLEDPNRRRLMNTLKLT